MAIKHHIRIAAGERTLVSIDAFEIPENRITLLLGESGIGKSLAAKAVYGILDPSELVITMDNEPYEKYLQRSDVRELRANSFFVFQEPSTHLNPLMTLDTQLNEGNLSAAPHQQEILDRLFDKFSADDIRRLLAVYPKPYRPSGGEKQRILLAMAFKKIDLLIANGAPLAKELFVFDEPTGSLDNRYRDLFLSMLFERLRTMNFTALLITHDYSMIGTIAERYTHMMHLVAFKEFSLQRRRHGTPSTSLPENSVVMHDFQPKDYVQWLSTLTPVPSANGDEARPLLTIAPDATVFGRHLRITSRPNHDVGAPLVLRRGSMVYLKAASGVGKTTIVKAVMGLLRAEKLLAHLDGVEISERSPRQLWRERIWGKKMALVFQHADEALNLGSSVKEVFAGLPTMANTSDDDVRRLLAELFDGEFDETFLKKKVAYLSGGQKQRLNLLRSLSLNTDVLILDEPLNGLDFESGGKVIAMLQRKQREGKGILVISHNEEIFDRLVEPQNVYYLSALNEESGSLNR
jgi:peptide/nickel transport system ATP-binding protein